MFKIDVFKGDITKMKFDAIVNAANSSLMGGGGVDGAIHSAGGPTILEECKEIVKEKGGCPTGNAVFTTGGNLPVKYVIHTVGPIWRGGNNNEEKLLSSCYTNSLVLANELNCKSIAFPNISTGIYGFPKISASKIAVESVTDFQKSNSNLNKVTFVCFDQDNFYLIKAELGK